MANARGQITSYTRTRNGAANSPSCIVYYSVTTLRNYRNGQKSEFVIRFVRNFTDEAKRFETSRFGRVKLQELARTETSLVRVWGKKLATSQ